MYPPTSYPKIWEVPAVREKVAKVNKYIAGMLRTRNLFGWRSFIEDLKTEIELEIYNYEGNRLEGKPGFEKEQGVGAYCNMAVQGALNWSFKCQAQCRRINYETMSLDMLVATEKGAMTLQIPDENNHDLEVCDLLLSIEQDFGDDIRSLAQAVLNGEQLSRKELLTLRKATKNEKMRKLLVEDY
ncbi:MAG: hypothetical protein NC218_02050 [Acetobacter sp.]|nr:hypothetical protein [Acetobacter sp.]